MGYLSGGVRNNGFYREGTGKSLAVGTLGNGYRHLVSMAAVRQEKCLYRMDWKRRRSFSSVFPTGFFFAGLSGFSVGVIRYFADILADIKERLILHHTVSQYDGNLLFTCFIFSDVWILNYVL